MEESALTKVLNYYRMERMRDKFTGFLYHYTDSETAKKIISDGKISFRMTLAEDFEDIHEGRQTVEIFYDLALEKLKANHIIDADTFDELSQIEVPKSKNFFAEHNDEMSGAFGEIYHSGYEAYVICFSTVAQDDYMYKTFVKKQEKECLCFDANVLQMDSAFKDSNGKIFEIVPTIYGMDNVTQIYEFIKRLYDNAGNTSDENVYKTIRGIIKTYLSALRYRVKLGRYRKENEVRLIVYVPEKNSGKQIANLRTTEENNKKYCYCDFGLFSYNEKKSSGSAKNV